MRMYKSKVIFVIKIMYANQHQQRVNHSMSIDSSGISLSKMTQKKSPFYKHQDPFKLNYYARFSPNRKQIDKNLNLDSLGGTSPLSPKTQRSSASSKKSSKSIMTKIQKDQPSINLRQQFQLIDQNVLLSTNQKHQERGEIFIDDSDYSGEDDINQNNLKGSERETKNYVKQNKFTLPSFAIDIPIYQNLKESSSSQESSSFDRLIDPSSSQDNDIPFFAIKKSVGGQMLIQDGDSQDQDNDQVTHLNIENQFGILDGSEKKILQLAKSIGAYKQQKLSNDIKKQIQSQNNSFSLHSDLSFIEQKWNSYFQTDQKSLTSRSQVLNEPFLGQNVCEKLFQNPNQHSNQRKMSSSSQQELPSFSNPDNSNYKITPLESQRSSALSQKIPSFNKYQVDSNPQTKQFKRQFTFGNQLNTIFVQGIQQKQAENHKIQPLLKKLMSKNAIQTFISKKDKNKSNQDQIKPKNIHSNSKIVSKLKQAKPSTKQHSKSINIKLNLSANQKIRPLQFHSNEDQDQSQSIYFFQQNKKNCEILIIDEPSSPEQKVHKIQSPKKQVLPIMKKKDFSKTKQSEKARKRGLWQQTLKEMLEKERKQKQKQTINNSQQSQQDQNYEENQQDKTEQKNKNDQRLNEIENEDLKVNFQEIPYKTQKFIEQSSYSKIYSEKKLYKSRKGSYNDKAKISQSQYQSSQEESVSQKNRRNYRPKSQDGESFTTATQQTSQNVQIYPHYFSRNISNCTKEVQNLKKYLQRIDDSPVSKKSEAKKISTFELNESFESQGNQKDSMNESHQRISFEQYKQVTHEKQNFVQIEPQLIQIKENQANNQLQNLHNHIQLIEISPMKSTLETLNKINQNQTQLLNVKLPQCVIQTQTAKQQIKTFNFTKSLSMLENLMSNPPNEFTKIYQKIYSQVYQQQLKYQNKLQKQQFLLKFMNMFVQGEQQKIDCEDFLIHEELNSDKSQRSSEHQDNLCESKKEQTQIFINKHIILALVRNLASKQRLTQI